ncbi:expressed unknown protein [Seminavis robusta]|uniref:Uncharacterized protein n=1 Tax=Seminavis robusta TaxID=568900 RepID=A0A9N8HAA4_9STRA|nr:expressed unknown protein [Seminavis robusta]|eukprot:Sro141_g065950.1 n/a (184) ;mRNA; f:97012-97563
MAYRTSQQAEDDESKSRMLASIFPELESKFGQYPMKHGNWMYPIPTETDQYGRPAFIECQKSINDTTPHKEHYVYGSVTHERLGKRSGYYHLLTKEAHKILHKRTQKPHMKLHYFFCTDPIQRTAWATTRQIVQLRSVSGLADDDHAGNTRDMMVAFQGDATGGAAGQVAVGTMAKMAIMGGL